MKPTIGQIVGHINGLNLGLNISCDLTADKLTANDWTGFELIYKKGKLPILVECDPVEPGNGDASEEIEEFIDEIGTPGLFASGKRKVIRHLRETKYIVSNQLLTADIDNDGYKANGEFLKYFVANFDGMIYADGEGFYEGNKLILKLE